MPSCGSQPLASRRLDQQMLVIAFDSGQVQCCLLNQALLTVRSNEAENTLKALGLQAKYHNAN